MVFNENENDPNSNNNNNTLFLVLTTTLIGFFVILLWFGRRRRRTVSFYYDDNNNNNSVDYGAFSPSEYRAFALIRKEIVTHNTRRFTFVFKDGSNHKIPIGRHVLFSFRDVDGFHERSYTPVTGNETLGEVSFIIKIYKPSVQFPHGGKMTQYLDSLQLGATVAMKGPVGHVTYKGNGRFSFTQKTTTNTKNNSSVVVGAATGPNTARSASGGGLHHVRDKTATRIGIIAGGSGITPMLRIINSLLNDVDTIGTTISLLYANVSEEDILLREELESIAAKCPWRMSIHYTVNQISSSSSSSSDKWPYSIGFVNKDMIAKHMPLPYNDYGTPPSTTRILLCGPPPMIRHVCLPALRELGFDEDQCICF